MYLNFNIKLLSFFKTKNVSLTLCQSSEQLQDTLLTKLLDQFIELQNTQIFKILENYMYKICLYMYIQISICLSIYLSISIYTYTCLSFIKIKHKVKQMAFFFFSYHAHSFSSTTKHLGKITLHMAFTLFVNHRKKFFWTNKNAKCDCFKNVQSFPYSLLPQTLELTRSGSRLVVLIKIVQNFLKL